MSAVALIAQIRAAWARFRSQAAVRSEIAWVLFNQTSDFVAQFALLKLLTNGLGKEGFGEYNLADTALVMLYAILLVPIQEPFARQYHAAREEGSLRGAGVLLMRWYGVALGGLVVIAAASSPWLAERYEVGRFTPLAAALLFAGERVRVLGLELLNLRRERRAWALWNVAFQSSLAVCTALALALGAARAHQILFAQAALTVAFALPNALGFAREFLSSPQRTPSRLASWIPSFGVPFALLLVFQWLQSFSDRYVVKAYLDAEAVGLYVAAYQVCGIPFTLMTRALHNLLTPIAYQRAGDGSDAGRVHSADRLLLAGIGVQAAVGIPMIGAYAILGPWLIRLLTNESFQLPIATIVALTIARFVQALAQGFQPIFAVHQRVGRMLGFRMFGGVASVAVCALATARWGLPGAALGSAIAFALYAIGLVFGPGGAYWLIRRGSSE